MLKSVQHITLVPVYFNNFYRSAEVVNYATLDNDIFLLQKAILEEKSSTTAT